MKKGMILIGITLFIWSCNSVKKTQEAVNAGDYISAIDRAVDHLGESKTKKGHQPYVLLLEEAFEKHTERELAHIDFLEKEGNPAHLEDIFQTYRSLKSVQERIRPLLPLQLVEENRQAVFQLRDYDQKIIDTKSQLADHLYVRANGLLQNAHSKRDYRNAYADYKYLLELSPGYADARSKMETAHTRGTDHVRVHLGNQSDKILPKTLQDELLNFNTYGLNDLWTQYHTNRVRGIDYDYAMEVIFKEINISPEQISEKQLIREKQIPDGHTYLTDDDGNMVKDSLGNTIKVPKFKTVTCDFHQFTQFKSVAVAGTVTYTDLVTRQPINSYPLGSEFIFEHVY
ncbi:MAG: hypothetical protein AB3N16_02740, partial [Flavobacteriaceae bacterium]